MNNSKTLQDIAEQACNFDRAHFDDDVEPIPEAIISNHERLPSDRKLITRLRPRHAVALGFFEGYVKAVEDGVNEQDAKFSQGGKIDGKPWVTHVRERLGAKPNEGVIYAVERVVKERDELRDAINRVSSLSPKQPDRANADRSMFLDHLRAIQVYVDLVVTPVARADDVKRKLNNYVSEVIERIEKEGQTGANIGIVKKPPPPPPPANEECPTTNAISPVQKKR